MATTQEWIEGRPEWLTDDIKAALLANNLPLDKDGMLMLWQRTKDLLTTVKNDEMEYRKICAAFLVPEKTEGTTNVELGAGYVAKVVTKYNYKPKDDNEAIWKGLEKIEQLTNDGRGKEVAKRLFSWTPNFLKTEYVSLKEEADKGDRFAIEAIKIIENELIVITEAAPTLEIREPSKKKK